MIASTVFINYLNRMLNIRRILDDVCDDCIDVIMDYIESPHDILKLIYYNKYYLYCNKNTGENNINSTKNTTQLLLYEKFYIKVMDSMQKFASNSGVNWNDIVKLLNDDAIIAGGSLLQSMYGDIRQTTDIPIHFYHDEFFDIFGKNKLEEYTHFAKKYKKKNCVTVMTDIDIFTMTNEKIFGKNSIVQYEKYGKYIENELEIFSYNDGSILLKFTLKLDYDKNTEFVLDDIENYRPRRSDGWRIDNQHITIRDTDDINITYSIRDACKLLENVNIYVSIENATATTKYKICIMEIPDVNNFVDNYEISSTGILKYIATNKNDMIKIKKNRMYESAILGNDNCDIKDYLLESGDNLLNKMDAIFEKDRKKSIYDGLYTSYDSKQCISKTMTIGSHYDPYKKNKKDDVAMEISHINPYHHSMALFDSKCEEAKLVPLTRHIGGLILNLIYLNQNIYSKPRDFIADDFDIDICRQSFDGNKIKLHAIKNLIHKKFEYNMHHIKNNELLCRNNREIKYVCFRKRLEKYKARGFICVDENIVIDKVKHMLKIEKNVSSVCDSRCFIKEYAHLP